MTVVEERGDVGTKFFINVFSVFLSGTSRLLLSSLKLLQNKDVTAFSLL